MAINFIVFVQFEKVAQSCKSVKSPKFPSLLVNNRSKELLTCYDREALLFFKSYHARMQQVLTIFNALKSGIV